VKHFNMIWMMPVEVVPTNLCLLDNLRHPLPDVLLVHELNDPPRPVVRPHRKVHSDWLFADCGIGCDLRSITFQRSWP
jgi:hypothetical protein